MLLTLWIVPWLSAKKARKLKQQVTQTQKTFLKRYYDYKEGHEELKRFNRSDDFKIQFPSLYDNLMICNLRNADFFLFMTTC